MITDDADTILNAERIILPGVGAFGNAMAQLEKTGLDEVIREAVRRKIPFLESVLVFSSCLKRVMKLWE